MNTENSKTNESHRFRLSLVDKLNLKNPNINMALDNHDKTIIDLKFLLQLGMMNLICLMELIPLQISKTTFNLPSKNMLF